VALVVLIWLSPLIASLCLLALFFCCAPTSCRGCVALTRRRRGLLVDELSRPDYPFEDRGNSMPEFAAAARTASIPRSSLSVRRSDSQRGMRRMQRSTPRAELSINGAIPKSKRVYGGMELMDDDYVIDHYLPSVESCIAVVHDVPIPSPRALPPPPPSVESALG
jgi:hypothetical protein